VARRTSRGIVSDRRAPLLISNGPLLNFFTCPFILPHPVTREDWRYASVEHRFQAMKGMYAKFGPRSRASWHDWIESAGWASLAKQRGQEVPLMIEAWDLASFHIMVEAQLAKFSQNPVYGAALLGTGSRRLVEYRPDRRWGDGRDGSGQNLCGKSLMIVRKVLRESLE
jgi:ribA/ribD-fused uncharacterized protein